MTTSKEWYSLPETQRNIIMQFQQTLPIKVGSIAQKLGITIKRATLAAGISGEIKLIDGKCIVRVNRHDVKTRQRFTVAHEIAHFLLHRELIGDGITDDILYRSTLSDTLEAQANRLAADIVMPWGLIKNYLDQNPGLRTEQKIERLADLAELSTTAIKIRLGKG